MSLADEIANEATTLAFDYPKGATPEDLAGYFGVPLPQIEHALDVLERRGTPLPFVKATAVPKEQWHPGRARPSTKRKAIPHEPWHDPKQVWTTKPAGPAKPGFHPNKKTRTAPEERADEVRYLLPELVPLFPHGFTAAQFREHFNIGDANQAYGVITALQDNGDIVASMTYVKPHCKILFVRGMRELPPPLTDLQERVHQEILRRAEGNPRVVVNYLHVAKAANVSPGSVPQVCWTLERKGYIERLTPYEHAGGEQSEPGGRLSGQRSPEYQILSPQLRDPFEDMPPPSSKLPAHPYVAPEIRDDKAIKRATSRRAELIREIEKIDAFLAAYEDFS